MKQVLTALSVLTIFSVQGQRLEKLWETDTILAIPESVLPDTERGLLYISLIDGGPWDADGRGGIGRIKEDGTQYDSTWITGLHAPKGMGLLGNHLYVADVSEVIVIDVQKAKVEKRIPIIGATGLNDIAVSDDGVVYVSDSKTAKIWRLEKDRPALFLDSMHGVNGLKLMGEDLIIASGKSFVKATPRKQLTPIAELPQGGDGIEPLGNGDYLVSSWSGYLYLVSANGQVKTLLDTHEQKKNIADIGYDSSKKVLYIPTFFAKTVVAYKVN